MKRHSFLARLGPADTSTVKVLQTDSLQTTLYFVNGYRRLGFGLGRMIERLSDLGIVPSESAIDLAILATLVTAADTRIARDVDAQDGWTREIDLYLPVADVERWTSMKILITRTLGFLTGDHWRLFIRNRDREYASLVQVGEAPSDAPFTSVSLFSGGLDSFVGAIDPLPDFGASG